MEEPILLYITCANKDEAKSIARVLVEERLIACANILGKIISIYSWEGAVAEEHVLEMASLFFDAERQ